MILDQAQCTDVSYTELNRGFFLSQVKLWHRIRQQRTWNPFCITTLSQKNSNITRQNYITTLNLSNIRTPFHTVPSSWIHFRFFVLRQKYFFVPTFYGCFWCDSFFQRVISRFMSPKKKDFLWTTPDFQCKITTSSQSKNFIIIEHIMALNCRIK